MTESRHVTLNFERQIAASAATVWQAWTAPAARALWAAPSPEVTVDIAEADNRLGGHEVSFCRVDGMPDVRCDVGWLVMDAPHLSVNHELVQSSGQIDSAALITARVSPQREGSHLSVTVQLASLAEDMADGYRAGYGAGLDNLSAVASRTMIIERVIKAPVEKVWGAWVNPETLPQWWGPDGFSCRTARIDLRRGGEWVFDMIAPDGTVFPNHHRYHQMLVENRLEYTLHWGENGPKHADAWASFDALNGVTKVTLGMVMASKEDHDNAMGFGAPALGLQTLGKLARLIGAE